jgi:S-DNA-T family DNA segregation ATPase FtsK/SpoIIIE
MKQRYIEEVIGIAFLSLSILVFLSLASYTPRDLSWYTAHPNIPVKNAIDVFGAYLSGILYFVLGHASYLIPLVLFIFSMKWFKKTDAQMGVSRIIGLVIAFLSFSSFFAIFVAQTNAVRFHRGGIVGLIFSDFLINYFGKVGAYVIIVSLGLLSLPLVAEISIIPLFSLIKQAVLFTSEHLAILGKRKPYRTASSNNRDKTSIFSEKPRLPALKSKQPELEFGIKAEKEDKKVSEPKIISDELLKPKIQIAKQESKTKDSVPAKAARIERQIEDENYILPSLDLLESPPAFSVRQVKDDLQTNAHILEDTLSDFGISVRVSNIERGPVITRYELEPAPGVKVQKIVTLSDDIALALKATSVRIVAPIPGKAAVGIEVPNSHSSVVFLKDVLGCSEYQQNKSKLTLALGKDIAGKPVIADLGEMPHLLIAGTTGSGKTVCVNSIIMAMLFNSAPS